MAEEAASKPVKYQFESDSEYMNEEPVEVIELTQEEWDSVAQKHLNALGLTRAELRAKIEAGTESLIELKVWWVVRSSTIE